MSNFANPFLAQAKDNEGNLKMLEDTIRNHKDYCIFGIATTGIDDGETEHYPTKIVLKKMKYDVTARLYAEDYSLNLTVKAPDTAVSAALENERYDALKEAGIDKDDYVKGINVKSIKEAQNEVKYFLSSLGDTVMIAQSNIDFSKKYLEKIGCENIINNRNVIDFTKLLKEYFEGKDDSLKRFSLDSVSKYIKAPSLTEPDLSVKKVKLANDIITYIGKQEDIVSKMAEHIQAEDKKKQAEYDAFVEEGKAKYANSSYKDKFDMLVNRSNLQTDVKNQKDLNTLQDTLKNNKDYCVLQIATTGFKPSEADIIKLTCIYIKNIDGKYRPADKLEFNIAASPQNIIKAENNKSYDYFGEAGIDLLAYKNGDYISKEAAVNSLNDFLSKYSCTLVCGSGTDFTKRFLDTLGQIKYPECVDFNQALKEFEYNAIMEGLYEPIALPTNFSLKDVCEARKNAFGINYDLTGTFNKAKTVAVLVNEINKSFEGRLNPVLVQDNIVADSNIKTDIDENLIMPDSVDTSDETDEISEEQENEYEADEVSEDEYIDYGEDYGEYRHMYEDDYEETNGYTFTKDVADYDINDLDNTDKEESANALRELKEENISLNKESDTTVSKMMENDNNDTVRQIYSNLKDDHVDIVTGDVTKIGEASIPHVSKAKDDVPVKSENTPQTTIDLSPIVEELKAHNELLKVQNEQLILQNKQTKELLDGYKTEIKELREQQKADNGQISKLIAAIKEQNDILTAQAQATVNTAEYINNHGFTQYRKTSVQVKDEKNVSA
jgi:hypothetical protein